MKILKLSFENINSIKGQWLIDFTAKEFTKSGLFGIFGPTGSGKSSIIDAICLALYDETPRQSKGSNAINILTTDTKSAFTEVEFEVNNIIYVVHWTARFNRNNNFTQPKRKLINKITGEVFEGKTEVSSKIIEIVGMDYSRFVKSAVLAQGEFSKFLKEGPKERANLLEKITEGEIYSEISKLCYLYKKEKEEVLNLKEKELGFSKLLSDEELSLKKSRVQEFENKISELDKDIESVRKKLNQVNSLKEKQDAIDKLNEDLISIEKDLVSISANLADYKLFDTYPILFRQYETVDKKKKEIKQFEDDLKFKQSNLEEILLDLKSLESRKQELLAKEKQVVEDYSNKQENIVKVQRLAILTDGEENIVKSYSDEIEKLILSIDSNKSGLVSKEKAIKEFESILGKYSHNLYYFNKDKFYELRDFSNKLDQLQQELVRLKQYEKNEQQSSLDKNELNECRNKINHLTNQNKLLDDKYSNYSGIVNYSKKLHLTIVKEEAEYNLKYSYGQCLINGEPCPLCDSTEHNGSYIDLTELKSQLELNKSINEQLQTSLFSYQENAEAIKSLKQKVDNLEFKLSSNNDGTYYSSLVSPRTVLAVESEIEETLNKLRSNFVDEFTKLDLKSSDDLTISLKAALDKHQSEVEEKQSDIDFIKSQLEKDRKSAADFENVIKYADERLLNLKLNRDSSKEKIIAYDNQKKELIGDSTLEDYRNQVSKAVEDFKKLVKDNDEKIAIKLNNKSLSDQQISDDNQKISEYNFELTRLSEEFKVNLNASGLTFEKVKQVYTNYDKFLSDQDKFNKLKSKQDETIGAKNNLLDEKNKLVSELDIDLSIVNILSTTVQNIETDQSNLNSQKNNLQDEKAAIQNELAIHDQNSKSMESIIGEINELRIQVSRARQLSELIGSESGDKFSMFAQSFAFEFLINEANKQMSQLSPRYQLVQDYSGKLDLQIEDSYHGAQRRPISTLSGGETFLVSLALAFGLASLTSSKINIETIFIDEGFGSLDSESLEQVIEILSNLHQNGKSVGVISHVQEMKQSIECAINIIPQSNGTSLIEGSGVTQLN